MTFTDKELLIRKDNAITHLFVTCAYVVICIFDSYTPHFLLPAARKILGESPQSAYKAQLNLVSPCLSSFVTSGYLGKTSFLSRLSVGLAEN